MGFGLKRAIGLSFLSLPVIPSLKITDKGLVDVEAFKFDAPVMTWKIQNFQISRIHQNTYLHSE
jgi:hypothetical protein